MDLFYYYNERNNIGYRSVLATYIKNLNLYTKKVNGIETAITVEELNSIDRKYLAKKFANHCEKTLGSIHRTYKPIEYITYNEALEHIEAYIEKTLVRQYYYFSIPELTAERKKKKNIDLSFVPGAIYKSKLNCKKIRRSRKKKTEDNSRKSIVSFETLMKFCNERYNTKFEEKLSINRVFRIYFAGKIASNDWRHNIVKDLRLFDMDSRNELFINKNLIYGGPFFISCDHSCYHGRNSHGVGVSYKYNNMWCQDTPPKSKNSAFSHCCNWIDNSDIIFAYIDSNDAYGTLWELGYAYRSNKKIFIATNKKAIEEDWDEDLWFSYSSANVCVKVSDELEAFNELTRYIKYLSNNVATSKSAIELATIKQIYYVKKLIKNTLSIILTNSEIRELEKLTKNQIGGLISILQSKVELEGYYNFLEMES